MEKKLNFNEVLPMEELAPVELNAIVGGTNAIKIVGANGHSCSCGNTTQTTDSTSVKKP